VEVRFGYALHFVRDRAVQPNRPGEPDVEWGILRDAPRITQDDDGLNDPRGSVCHIDCESQRGQTLRVVVNYTKTPLRVVTAYYP
jgi:hypothetical protein